MIFINAALKKDAPYTPIWLMRQAGRYLSEYQATRAKAGSFLDLCQNVALATEVTLQPVEILDVDAAILFSDILVLPMAMGLELEFVAGEGPRFLQTTRDESSINALKSGVQESLSYVYDTISSVRSKLAKDKALIGFCGAPWTLATYMIEGQGSKSYAQSKRLLYTNPQALHTLLSKLTTELIAYLSAQIRAGANAVQIFDSWAGALSPRAYIEFGFSYMCEIARALKKDFPSVPVMLFPKGVGALLERRSAMRWICVGRSLKCLEWIGGSVWGGRSRC